MSSLAQFNILQKDESIKLMESNPTEKGHRLVFVFFGPKRRLSIVAKQINSICGTGGAFLFVQTKKNKEIMESNSTGGLITCLVRDKVIRNRTSSAASSNVESTLGEPPARIQEIINAVLERIARKQEVTSVATIAKQQSHDTRQIRSRPAFTD